MAPFSPDAPTRARQRIKRLLEDRGYTNRALGKAIGHGDQWVSNMLSGRQRLSLRDLDSIAVFLRVPPGEIVRVSDEPWELSPTEMRAIRALRMLPPPVRDFYVGLADWTVGVVPEEAERLQKIRQLSDENMEVVDRYIEMKLFEQSRGPRAPNRVDDPPATAPPARKARRTRGQR